MLYQIYETQRALMAPFSEFASASAKLYDHPLSPFARLDQQAHAASLRATFEHRCLRSRLLRSAGLTNQLIDGRHSITHFQ